MDQLAEVELDPPFLLALDQLGKSAEVKGQSCGKEDQVISY